MLERLLPLLATIQATLTCFRIRPYSALFEDLKKKKKKKKGRKGSLFIPLQSVSFLKKVTKKFIPSRYGISMLTLIEEGVFLIKLKKLYLQKNSCWSCILFFIYLKRNTWINHMYWLCFYKIVTQKNVTEVKTFWCRAQTHFLCLLKS
jgi:hypothetical protein